MPETNIVICEELLTEAVGLHADGRYSQALEVTETAFDLAPDMSFVKGRAARDMSARYNRLGDHGAGAEWAATAYAIHNDLALVSTDANRRGAYRERGASAVYVGVSSLQAIIALRRQHPQVTDMDSLRAMRSVLPDIAVARDNASGLNRIYDQYDINASRRISIAESLMGDPRRGLLFGLRSLLLAGWSESKRLDTTNHTISDAGRRRAKAIAFGGAIAALGVNALSRNRYTRNSKLNLDIAQKTL